MFDSPWLKIRLRSLAVSAAWHSTARYSTAWHSTTLQPHMAQHDTAHHSTAQHGELCHSTAWHSTTQHGTAQHSTAQHSTAQHSTAQHSTRLQVSADQILCNVAGTGEVQALLSAAIIFLLQQIPNRGGFAPATVTMAAGVAYNMLADCSEQSCSVSDTLAVWGPHLRRCGVLCCAVLCCAVLYRAVPLLPLYILCGGLC